MNDTFRENVLMGREFDKELFWKVVEASALTEDVQQFPARDQTEIGSNGINLSGGQIVRLALARALYVQADVYIFDDLLSAVDAHVERQIIERVLMADGIIGNKTRILVTHAEHLVPLSNTVISFSDGRFSISYQDPEPFMPATCLSALEKLSTSEKNGSEASNKSSKRDNFTIHPEIDHPQLSLKYIWRFIELSGYGTVSMIAVMCILDAYGTYYIENLNMDLILDTNPKTIRGSMKRYLVVSVVQSLAQQLYNNFESFLLDRLWSKPVLEKMRQQLVVSLLSLPLTLIESVPLAAFAFAAKARYDKLEKALEHMEFYDVMIPVSRSFGIILEHRNLLRIHGNGQTYLRRQNGNLAFSFNYYVISKAVSDLYFMVSFVCTELISTCIVAFSFWKQLHYNAIIAPGEVDIFISWTSNAFFRLTELSVINEELDINMRLLSRYYVYTEKLKREAPSIIEDSRPPADWPSMGTVEFCDYKMRYRKETDLALKGISFSVKSCEKIGIVGRTGAGKSSITFALMRMVEAAEGKIMIDGIDISTIGLHDLRSCITVIPQDPALFEGTIRENLDPYRQFTDDQIWEAIRTAQIDELVNTPTGIFVEKSEKEMEFDADDGYGPWIEGVGLNKWVKYGGENFSVGQRQLVSLCRALLLKRKIVILDEATANVDSKTDEIMQRIFRSKFNDCTVLTIAHRLGTIMDSDRILVINEGQAVEFDAPKVLLANKASYFSGLVESMKLNQGIRDD
ncbi:Canalicular multispecific organic anion transporter 1 [Coemansia sp. RSA 1722]|nr:Canalicular multispecific organic anion transporter 1 [Coemansia sp. RSA 1722]